MHETLRTRILRRLETLPESKLYQVLDYIEFLESQYGERSTADPSGLQRIAERLEDGMRKRTFNPSNLREAFQLISAADRVLSSVSEAGRELLSELQAGGDPLAERGGPNREIRGGREGERGPTPATDAGVDREGGEGLGRPVREDRDPSDPRG